MANEPLTILGIRARRTMLHLLAGMVLAVAGPVRANVAVPLNCRAPEMAAPVTVDGKLDEWTGPFALLRARPEQGEGAGSERSRIDGVGAVLLVGAARWEPARPGETYGGPKDCAARFYLAWDRENLYIAVQMYDNDLVPPVDGARMLEGDCILIAVDARDDASQGYDDDDSEFGFAYTAAGTLAWRSFPSERGGPLDSAKVAVVREVKPGALAAGVPPLKLTYEISIPWSELPGASREPGSAFGFDLAINDVDGGRRHGWLQWSAGLMGIKDPSRFGNIRLVGPVLAPAAKPPS